MAAIELRGVTKRYERRGILHTDSVTALQNVDLTVEDGDVFGFLGPNGAGKSTAIDIMLDYVAPTSGSVRVLGHDVDSDSVSVKERTGVLPDGYGPVSERTGREHLEFAIDAKDADDDPDELLARVDMLGPDGYPVDQYSKGMAQRLMLAMALVGEPDLLVLDEPSTGLDPNGARTMRRIVREENDRGATVFFSSHILEQVEAVCDRVAILDAGRLVTVDSIDRLRDTVGGSARVRLELSTVPDGVIERLEGIEGVSSVDVDATTVDVACENRAKAPAIATCYDSDATVTDVSTTEPSLDELFATVTEGTA
ncbi:ABC transporter ATP-binding protein [Natrarchaeobius halalkaliphilus]|uniref:ABC transporter ATP-binding protein n=1 Tax=Natrarchaeobius halalkaliphilus TaxID=1679091 RepID=A0A3N6LV33_9EURY|nr:ABC transporter ATP-binding protein [Natrarchaeobius halalkaliphilus]RQG91504.1 ABC transporter ATP-binding protein [Natrarchaeobius halalkaliphilus]